MSKLSANLGFLWADLPLVEAIYKAKQAGFDAVECHWPYDTPVGDVKKALQDTALPMLGLNTRRGDVSAGEAGLTAVPGREADARAFIDEAIDYGASLGSEVVHVMSGIASGSDAFHTFVHNLVYASEEAEKRGMGIVIEPINSRDIPGYFLNSVEQAADVINTVGRHNVKLMFDCYHVQIMQGDILKRLEKYLPIIGHIQIAAVPDRGEPHQGELNYQQIIKAVDGLGYQGYIGAEYKPRQSTDAGLNWMQRIL